MRAVDWETLTWPGIKDNQLRTLDGNLLPETMEWLIAAGNQISALARWVRVCAEYQHRWFDHDLRFTA